MLLSILGIGNMYVDYYVIDLGRGLYWGVIKIFFRNFFLYYRDFEILGDIVVMGMICYNNIKENEYYGNL